MGGTWRVERRVFSFLFFFIRKREERKEGRKEERKRRKRTKKEKWMGYMIMKGKEKARCVKCIECEVWR